MSVSGATKWRSVLHCAISCSTLCEATGHLEGEATGQLEGEATGQLEGEATGQLEGEATGQLEGEAAGQLEGEATGQLEGAAGTGLSKVDCTSAFQAFFSFFFCCCFSIDFKFNSSEICFSSLEVTAEYFHIF